MEVQEISDAPKELAGLSGKIFEGSFTVILDTEGKSFSSLSLAAFFRQKLNQGSSRFCFVVGGSVGLPEEIKKKAGLLWSFSDLTFPHHVIRILALEQVYRAFSILGGRKYHK